MAYVHFDLPDALVAEARAAGISIPLLCEEALVSALAGPNATAADPVVTQRRNVADDSSRYQAGFRLGQRWAAGFGTAEELKSIATVGSSRWQDLALDAGSHSLVDLLVEEGVIDRADDRTAWLSRDAFSEGLVDAVAAVVPQRQGP